MNDRINFNTGCISMYPDDETAKVKFPDWYINIKIEWRINVFTLQYPFENKHTLYRDLMYLSGEISCVLQCWETNAVAWGFFCLITDPPFPWRLWRPSLRGYIKIWCFTSSLLLSSPELLSWSPNVRLSENFLSKTNMVHMSFGRTSSRFNWRATSFLIGR